MKNFDTEILILAKAKIVEKLRNYVSSGVDIFKGYFSNYNGSVLLQCTKNDDKSFVAHYDCNGLSIVVTIEYKHVFLEAATHGEI